MAHQRNQAPQGLRGYYIYCHTTIILRDLPKIDGSIKRWIMPQIKPTSTVSTLKLWIEPS